MHYPSIDIIISCEVIPGIAFFTVTTTSSLYSGDTLRVKQPRNVLPSVINTPDGVMATDTAEEN